MLDVPDKYKRFWMVEGPHCPLKDTVIPLLLMLWWCVGVPTMVFAAGYFGIPYLARLAGVEFTATPVMSGAAALTVCYCLWPAISRWTRKRRQNAS